jgi:hypothetical protein
MNEEALESFCPGIHDRALTGVKFQQQRHHELTSHGSQRRAMPNFPADASWQRMALELPRVNLFGTTIGTAPPNNRATEYGCSATFIASWIV